MPKTVYYKDKDSMLEVEEVGKLAFVHASYESWSVSVLKQSYRVFATLIEDYTQRGFEQIVTITPNPKFCKLFNGTTQGFLTFENKEYEVIKWELK